MFGRIFRRCALVLAAAVMAPAAMSAPAVATPTVWRMIDLGAGDDSEVSAINDLGHVVGMRPGRGAFLWRDGEFTDLGSFWPTDINNHDEVVGQGGNGEVSMGVLWRDGVLTYLGSDIESTGAAAVNDRGDIVGYRSSPWGDPEKVVVWRDGVRTTIDGVFRASDINNRGDIVGFSYEPEPLFGRYAVRWSRGMATGVSEAYSEATAVNQTGTVVGWVIHDTGDGMAPTEGFVWRRGDYITIPTPPPPPGVYGPSDLYPNAINNRGQVAGSTNTQPFLWDNSGITILPTPPDSQGYAYDINNHGVVVGVTRKGGVTHAVLWVH